MKTCGKCKLSQVVENFAIKNKNTGSRNSWCKNCNKLYQKQHYLKNSEKYKAKARAYEEENGGSFAKRLKVYSLSVEQYDLLIAKYDGLCWMCKKKEATVIDHDHSCCPGYSSCGYCVRGMLCATCNMGLGLLGDNIEGVNLALNYLKLDPIVYGLG